MRHQLTGNAGLYHVPRELSRGGWHVMSTIRNARGADLHAANDDELPVLPIQSKALFSSAPVPLGSSLNRLLSDGALPRAAARIRAGFSGFLYRWARNVGVGAKYTAVAGERPQHRRTMPTIIEELASVGRHRLGRDPAALGAGQSRGEQH